MIYLATLFLFVVDALGSVFAWKATYFLRVEIGMYNFPFPPEFVSQVVFSCFWILLFVLRGMYRTPVALSRFDEIVRCFQAVLIGMVVIYLVTFDTSQPVASTRFYLLTYGFLMFCFCGTGRVLVRIYQRVLRERRIGLWNAVIVGFNDVGQMLNHQLHFWPVWGYDVIGFVDPIKSEGEHLGVEILGRVEDLPLLIREKRIQWVLLAPAEQNSDAVLKTVDLCRPLQVRFMIVANYYQMVVGLVRTVQIHGLPLVEIVPHLVPFVTRCVKRTIDVLMGLIMTVVVGLITPIAGLAIKLNSPGSIFFTQKRVGKGGREFTMIKFRSMVADAEKTVGPVWASINDPRVTFVGKFLRRTHLDELPQFINVLFGQMSIVGPRPERREFVERHKDRIPLYERRMLVRPGITGWAQVRHKYDEKIEDVIEKTRYDLFYVDRISLALDMKIIMSTFWNILQFKGQ